MTHSLPVTRVDNIKIISGFISRELFQDIAINSFLLSDALCNLCNANCSFISPILTIAAEITFSQLQNYHCNFLTITL